MKKFWRFKRPKSIHFFISIGAGLNQIPLIREAKKLGLNIIGVDYNPSAPGFFYCDLKIQESITNYKDIYHTLQELLVDGEISGILTKSYGTAITTTAHLSSKFNIPYLPEKVCENFIDKIKMKKTFKSHGLPTSKTIKIQSGDIKGKINNEKFPLIFKPVTGHGKIGVKLISSTKELSEHIKEHNSNESSFVLEEYIQGEEIIALGIVNDKKFHLVDITDKQTSPLPNFVDVMHVSPSKHYHLFNKIQELGQAVSGAFSIITSPLIMEMIVTENEDLYIIEAVPEFGGEFLSDILVPARTGYNFIGQAIKANTRFGFTPPVQKNSKNSVVVKYISGTKGTLASCTPKGPEQIKQTIFSRIFKEIGSEVDEPVNNLDRIGVVVVKDKTTEAAMASAQKAVDSLNIRIKQ